MCLGWDRQEEGSSYVVGGNQAVSFGRIEFSDKV